MKEDIQVSESHRIFAWLMLIVFIALVVALTLYQVRATQAAPLGSFLDELNQYQVGGLAGDISDGESRLGGWSMPWVWLGMGGLLLLAALGIVWYRHNRHLR